MNKKNAAGHILIGGATTVSRATLSAVSLLLCNIHQSRTNKVDLVFCGSWMRWWHDLHRLLASTAVERRYFRRSPSS